MTMYDFFKNELNELEKNTGIKQLDSLVTKLNHKKHIDDLLNACVAETEETPFGILEPELKQKIIHTAVMEDEFFGLNPKFVRKALMTWWKLHRDVYMEARNKKEAENIPDISHEEKVKNIETYLPQVLEAIAKVETNYTTISKDPKRYPVQQLGRLSTGVRPTKETELDEKTWERAMRQWIADEYGELPEDKVLEILEQLKVK